MRRSENRILTSHTGKLFKPGSGYAGFGNNAPMTPEEVKQEVRELVQAQLDIGMDVISNGEPAGIGLAGLFALLDGVTQEPVELAPGETILSTKAIRWLPREMLKFQDFYFSLFERMGMSGSSSADRPSPLRTRSVVTGPLKLKSMEPLERDLKIFKEVLAEKGNPEAFYCMIAPAWAEEFIWNEYYKSDDEMVVALSEAMRPIFKAITDAGFILQLDDPAISHDWEEVRRPQMSLADYEKFMMIRVEALNAAIAGIPEEMIRYHVCWGSWPGMHTEDIPLKDIVKMILKVNAQGYSIEAAKTSHLHEWKVWRDVAKLPEGKILLPGVIDHTTNVVENPEVVADRLIAYANVVGRENVIAATDCGMRGHAEANWEKYKSIVKGAELASKQLWG
jgi:5-methyltetrahydropteroyltriglutamate--homocysteine methyltransferase